MIDVRERHSRGLNRARVRLELRRSASPLIVVAVGVAFGLASWLVILRNVGKQVYTPTHEVSFAVSDASGVIGRSRQELRFKGVPAGRISKVELRHGRPVVTAKMYNSFGPVYRDARVALRPTTAIEDMYIDVLDRGHRRAGVADSSQPIAEAQTTVGVQAEDVLNTFTPNVRTQLATTMRNLGGGLDERGDAVRAAFVQVAPFVDAAVRVSDQLRERADLTRKLVHNTAALTGVLADRDRQVRRLVEAGATSLEAIDASSDGLDGTLRELPQTLSGVRSSFAAVRDVIPRVDRALRALAPVTSSLPAGLAALRRLSDAADPALRRLRDPVRRLVPFSEALRPLSGALADATTALRPQIPAVDYITKAVAGCATGLQAFFQGTPSVMKWGDSRGYAVRGDAVIDVSSGGGVVKDLNKIVGPSCAAGGPVGGEPGPGGSR